MSHETDHRRDEALVSSVYHDIDLPEPSEELDAKVMQLVNKELEKTSFVRARHSMPSLIGSLSIAASLVLAIGIGFMLKTNQSNEAEVYMPEEVKAVKAALSAPAVELAPAPAAEPVVAPVPDATPFGVVTPAAPSVPPVQKMAANTAPVMTDATSKEAAKPVVPAPAVANKPTTMQIDSTLTLAPKSVAAAPPPPAKEMADAAPVTSAVSPAPIEARTAKVANQVPAKESMAKAKAEPADETVKDVAKEKSAKKEGVTTRTASDWLAQIRQLKVKGQSQKVEQELARFSTFYPDQPIPDDLK